jgi:hypothetical protein
LRGSALRGLIPKALRRIERRYMRRLLQKMFRNGKLCVAGVGGDDALAIEISTARQRRSAAPSLAKAAPSIPELEAVSSYGAAHVCC